MKVIIGKAWRPRTEEKGTTIFFDAIFESPKAVEQFAKKQNVPFDAYFEVSETEVIMEEKE